MRGSGVPPGTTFIRGRPPRSILTQAQLHQLPCSCPRSLPLTPAPVRQLASIAHKCCNHQRISKMRDRAFPVPCPDRRAGCSTTAATTNHIILCVKHGMMCTATGPKTVAVITEEWVKDRIQHLMHCLLDQTLNHREDAKLAHPFATGFRDIYFPDCRWLVAAVEQLFFDMRPVSVQVRAKFTDQHLVDSDCAPLVRSTRRKASLMFSRSTAASIRCIVSERKWSQLIAIPGTPTPYSRGFHPLPSEEVFGIKTERSVPWLAI